MRPPPDYAPPDAPIPDYKPRHRLTMTTNKTNYNANQFYTTHPNNITIRDVWVGNLTKAKDSGGAGTGSHGVRLSGTYAITVERVDVESCTYCGVFHHGGDVAFEFAPAALRRFAYRDTIIRGVTVKKAGKGYGFLLDTVGDNLFAAVASGYAPIYVTVYPSNLLVENCASWGDTSDTAGHGVMVQYASGVVIRNCYAAEHYNGVLVGDYASDTVIEGGNYHRSRDDGIRVSGSSLAAGPLRTKIVGARSSRSGQRAAGNRANIAILNATRTSVERNTVGSTDDDTALYGVYQDENSRFSTIAQNRCVEIATGGYAWKIAASTTFNALWLFTGNEYVAATNRYLDGGATERGLGYDGPGIIPVERLPSPGGGNYRTRYVTLPSFISGGKPTYGKYIVGEIIDLIEASSGSAPGYRCTASGAVGSWAPMAILGTAV